MLNSKKIDEKMVDELYELLLSLKTVDDYRMFFEDLCTQKEIFQMSQRIKAAKLLMAGNTYNQVIEQTDISSATLCRVSRCIQYGRGYAKFLK